MIHYGIITWGRRKGHAVMRILFGCCWIGLRPATQTQFAVLAYPTEYKICQTQKKKLKTRKGQRVTESQDLANNSQNPQDPLYMLHCIGLSNTSATRFCLLFVVVLLFVSNLAISVPVSCSSSPAAAVAAYDSRRLSVSNHKKTQHKHRPLPSVNASQRGQLHLSHLKPSVLVFRSKAMKSTSLSWHSVCTVLYRCPQGVPS